jgi:hypothetical protein
MGGQAKGEREGRKMIDLVRQVLEKKSDITRRKFLECAMYSLEGTQTVYLNGKNGKQRSTVTHLALPLTCGLSTLEVAGQVGEKTGWVTKRLKDLQREIERLNSL